MVEAAKGNWYGRGTKAGFGRHLKEGGEAEEWLIVEMGGEIQSGG